MKIFRATENHIRNLTLPSQAESEAVYYRHYKKHWGHTDDHIVKWRGHPSWLAARHHLQRVKTTAWMIIEAVAKDAGHCRECCDYIDYDHSDHYGWREYSLCRHCYKKKYE